MVSRPFVGRPLSGCAATLGEAKWRDVSWVPLPGHYVFCLFPMRLPNEQTIELELATVGMTHAPRVAMVCDAAPRMLRAPVLCVVLHRPWHTEGCVAMCVGFLSL